MNSYSSPFSIPSFLHLEVRTRLKDGGLAEGDQFSVITSRVAWSIFDYHNHGTEGSNQADPSAFWALLEKNTRCSLTARNLRDTLFCVKPSREAGIMEKQNITLSLEKGLLQKARILAAKRSISVSRLLSEELTRIVQEVDSFDQARQAALNDLEQGFYLGGEPAKREDLHER
jgi:hypothetical protein